MRTRSILLIALLSTVMALPEAANAQFSPQGLLNGVTRPFRMMLGRLGHFPRHRREAPMSRSPGEAGGSADSRLGRVGPPAWRGAYEDVIGYAFWPDDYLQRLRGHGFDVIADTISGPFEVPRPPAQASTNGAAVQDDASAVGAACRDTAGTPDNWPAERVSQTVQLSDAQHDTVDTIQKAVIHSTKTIKADCTDPTAQAAPDRLHALVQTLWAVHDAGTALRAQLKQFDDTLSEAQKTSFASRMPQEAPKPNPKTQTAAMNRQYQACAQPNIEEAERLIRQIELRVRPTRDQAASLENLHKVSSDMAKLLMASCAQPIAADPLARLDAANDQLTAMNYAATTVQIAFDDFYAKLDNAQKARFDSAGR
jgi:hypothetical protein